jgi:hypothetical protein
LANIFLEKLYKGEAINGNDLMKAVVNTLDLPDYRTDLINFLLNSEHFYATRANSKLRILQKLLQYQLHRKEANFFYLIKTIQISLASSVKQITTNEFKRLISIHSIIPVLYGPFLAMLL